MGGHAKNYWVGKMKKNTQMRDSGDGNHRVSSNYTLELPNYCAVSF